jgi:hypothetical protein
MIKIVSACLVLSLAVPMGALADTRDVLIALPQVAKTVYGLGFTAAALSEIGRQPPLGSAAALAVTSAVTLPSAMVLWSALHRDAAGTRLWRNVAFWVDASLAATSLGLGLYQLLAPTTDPEGWNKLVGTIFIVISIPLGAGAAVDRVPYSFE